MPAAAAVAAAAAAQPPSRRLTRKRSAPSSVEAAVAAAAAKAAAEAEAEAEARKAKKARHHASKKDKKEKKQKADKGNKKAGAPDGGALEGARVGGAGLATPRTPSDAGGNGADADDDVVALLDGLLGAESGEVVDIETAALDANEDPGTAAIRRRIQRMLIHRRGDCPIRVLEAELGHEIPAGLLDSGRFFVDEAAGLVGLPGELVSRLVEQPSYKAWAEEDEYWNLGQEVLKAGLDFSSEQRFRDLFEDLMAKREHLRRLSQRLGGRSPLGPSASSSSSSTRPGGAGRSQEEQTPHAMVPREAELLAASSKALRTLQTEDAPWVPLSRLLEDPLVRRLRSIVLKGGAYWEWLSMRFGEDLHLATDGRDLLLHRSGGDSAAASKASAGEGAGGAGAKAVAEAGSGPANELEGLRSLSAATRRSVCQASFQVLLQSHRDYPQANGTFIQDLARFPNISRFNVDANLLRCVLQSQPSHFQVFRERSGFWVRLCPGVLERAAGALAARQAVQRGMLRALPASPAPSSATAGGGRASPITPSAAPAHLTIQEWSRQQSERYSDLPTLPRGWLRASSRTSGQIYYINERTGATTFEVPRAPADAASGVVEV